MTALDILVFLLVGVVGVRGFMRGFTTEALSLLAWVLAIVAVKLLHDPFAYALEGTVGTTAGAAVLAFALIFGLTFLVGRLAANRLGGAARSSALGGFDRLLGLGFGLLKGLIAATLIFLIFTLFYNTALGGRAERPRWLVESQTYPLLNASARGLVDMVGNRQEAGT